MTSLVGILLRRPAVDALTTLATFRRLLGDVIEGILIGVTAEIKHLNWLKLSKSNESVYI